MEQERIILGFLLENPAFGEYFKLTDTRMEVHGLVVDFLNPTNNKLYTITISEHDVTGNVNHLMSKI